MANPTLAANLALRLGIGADDAERLLSDPTVSAAMGTQLPGTDLSLGDLVGLGPEVSEHGLGDPDDNAEALLGELGPSLFHGTQPDDDIETSLDRGTGVLPDGDRTHGRREALALDRDAMASGLMGMGLSRGGVDALLERTGHGPLARDAQPDRDVTPELERQLAQSLSRALSHDGSPPVVREGVGRLAKATASHASEADAAAEAMLSGEQRSAEDRPLGIESLALLTAPRAGERKADATQRIIDDIARLSSDPGLLMQAMGRAQDGLLGTAPASAAALRDRVAATLGLLQRDAPKAPPRSPVSPISTPAISHSAASAFERQLHAMLDPRRVMRMLGTGQLSTDEIRAFTEAHPATTERLRRAATRLMMAGRWSPPPRARRDLEAILGNVEPLLQPSAVARLQSPAPAPDKGSKPSGQGPSDRLAKMFQTRNDRTDNDL